MVTSLASTLWTYGMFKSEIFGSKDDIQNLLTTVHLRSTSIHDKEKLQNRLIIRIQCKLNKWIILSIQEHERSSVNKVSSTFREFELTENYYS